MTEQEIRNAIKEEKQKFEIYHANHQSKLHQLKAKLKKLKNELKRNSRSYKK